VPTVRPDVTLQEITASTVRAVAELSVTAEQRGYVANNAVSIAQAHFSSEAWFRSIHAGPELVGFAMLRDGTLAPDASRPASLYLWRFMIDQRFQRRGYGREALTLLVERARTRPGITCLDTSYVVGPHGPKDFYISFGFQHTGEITPKGEVCLRYDLPQQ
jgi:diamine N-acetyltransferase